MGWVCIQTPATGSGIKPGRLWGLRFTAKGTEAQPLGTVAAEQVAGVMEAPGLDLTENQVQTGPGSGWEQRVQASSTSSLVSLQGPPGSPRHLGSQAGGGRGENQSVTFRYDPGSAEWAAPQPPLPALPRPQESPPAPDKRRVPTVSALQSRLPPSCGWE